MASWTYKTKECFRCNKPLEEGEERTIPLPVGMDTKHYLEKVMNFSVCRECYREWKLSSLLDPDDVG